jgi:hypothetical protein
VAGESVVLYETSPLNRGQNISIKETLVNGYSDGRLLKAA